MNDDNEMLRMKFWKIRKLASKVKDISDDFTVVAYQTTEENIKKFINDYIEDFDDDSESEYESIYELKNELNELGYILHLICEKEYGC